MWEDKINGRVRSLADSNIRIRVFDGVEEAQVDYSGALVSMLLEHYKVHVGDSYVANYDEIVGASGIVDLLIQTPPNIFMNFTYSIFNDSEFSLAFYEDTDYTDGTSITVFNRKRTSSNTSSVIVSYDPTGSDTGTLIWSGRAGASGFLTSSIGNITSRQEFILKDNAKYLMRLTGSAGDSFHMCLDWYE